MKRDIGYTYLGHSGRGNPASPRSGLFLFGENMKNVPSTINDIKFDLVDTGVMVSSVQIAEKFLKRHSDGLEP